jgi:hypothetical protein
MICKKTQFVWRNPEIILVYFISEAKKNNHEVIALNAITCYKAQIFTYQYFNGE